MNTLEQRLEDVDDADIWTEARRYLRRHLPHRVVALHRLQILHRNRPELGNPAEVVALEIDQHDVFGALLRVRNEFGEQRPILGNIVRPRSRTGNRSCTDHAVAHADQAFR